MVSEVQAGDVHALRANTIATVAADFGGIADSVQSLKPLIVKATITVDSLYVLDASMEPAGTARTDFYCGTPVVVLNFTGLPPGTYALAIVEATGVPQPQQISLILSESADHHWILGGFFTKPLTEVTHDGLWYWDSARQYAQKKMNWDAWFYYRTAAYLLDPVDFLSSPNLEKLQLEEESVHPENLPGTKPLMLDAHGSTFEVTTIDSTNTFGILDLEVHYTPDAAQIVQLRDPTAARKQVTDLMSALLALHPELPAAFHGIWVNADGASATLFSLELPMNQIVPGQSAAAPLEAVVRGTTQDFTHPKMQPRLDLDHDPIPSLDAEDNALASTSVALPSGRPGEVQKRQDGIYTMHQDVDEVLLTCVVVDEKGRSITDLSRTDFHIWEDGAPQTTSSFLHQDQPVSLGILVDNSGSMLDKRAAVNAAALNLLRASNPLDVTFIVNFSDRAFLDQGFTSNIDALNRGLSHFDSKGTTALYDAVAASADELTNHAKLPRQVLLVITDGADNASHLDLEQAIRRVQNLGGPVVYTIGLLFGTDKDEAERARTALVRLSQETGGIAYFPRSLQEVDEVAAEVAHDIRDQYTIGFRSTKPASIEGYRAIRVEANASKRGRVLVRTRKGYYAKKSSSQPVQTAQATRQ
jgi:VWFA-related protein